MAMMTNKNKRDVLHTNADKVLKSKGTGFNDCETCENATFNYDINKLICAKRFTPMTTKSNGYKGKCGTSYRAE